MQRTLLSATVTGISMPAFTLSSYAEIIIPCYKSFRIRRAEAVRCHYFYLTADKITLTILLIAGRQPDPEENCPRPSPSPRHPITDRQANPEGKIYHLGAALALHLLERYFYIYFYIYIYI